MARHIAIGVAAVVENPTLIAHNRVWVDAADVPKALTALGKLTGEEFPEATMFKQVDSTRDRVCIEL